MLYSDFLTALRAVANGAGKTKTQIAASVGWPHSKLMRIVRAHKAFFREVNLGNTRAGHRLELTAQGRAVLENQAP